VGHKRSALGWVLGMLLTAPAVSAQEFLWVAQMGANTPDDQAETNDVAVDFVAAVLTVGPFWGTVDFDPGPVILTVADVAKADGRVGNKTLAAPWLAAVQGEGVEVPRQHGSADGTASPPAAQPAPSAQADHPNDSLPCEIRTADAHPDITWTTNMGCITRETASAATIEVVDYMTSGLYKFITECKGEGGTVLRVFEYKNKSRPYLLRLHRFVDAYTYVVITSYPGRNSGIYSHEVSEKANKRSRIKSCSPESGTSPPGRSQSGPVDVAQ